MDAMRILMDLDLVIFGLMLGYVQGDRAPFDLCSRAGGDN